MPIRPLAIYECDHGEQGAPFHLRAGAAPLNHSSPNFHTSDRGKRGGTAQHIRIVRRRHTKSATRWERKPLAVVNRLEPHGQTAAGTQGQRGIWHNRGGIAIERQAETLGDRDQGHRQQRE